MAQENTKYEELMSAGLIRGDTNLTPEEIEFVNENLTWQEVDTLKSIRAKVTGFVTTKDWEVVPRGFGF